MALRVRGLGGGPIEDVSFDLHRREVLGIAGLLGSGRTELLQMLFGARARRTGELSLDDAPYAPPSLRTAIERGVVYVPEDRAREAAFLDMNIAENLSSASARARRVKTRAKTSSTR